MTSATAAFDLLNELKTWPCVPTSPFGKLSAGI